VFGVGDLALLSLQGDGGSPTSGGKLSSFTLSTDDILVGLVSLFGDGDSLGVALDVSLLIKAS